MRNYFYLLTTFVCIVCICISCRTIPGGKTSDGVSGTPVALRTPGKLVPDKEATISVPQTKKPVQIDGLLVDEAWNEAVTLGDFVYGRSSKPEVDTKLLVTYDSNNLYIAVVNGEPNTGSLVTNATTRDGKVWNDDSVEVYIDPKNEKQRDYYGFFVSAGNTVYDRRHQENWNGEWTSATSVQKGKCWIVEMAIPFKTIEISPKSGHKLGIMVARNRRVGLSKAQGYFLAPCNREAKDTSAYPVFELK